MELWNEKRMGTPTLICLIACVMVSTSVRAMTDGSIHGRITDTLPLAVAGVEVSLYSIEYANRHPVRIDLVARTTTDEQGEYRFSEVKWGFYIVRAELPGFLTSKAWDVRPGTEPVDLTLTAVDIGDPNPGPPILSGIVRSQNGRPLQNATVTLIQCDNPAGRFQVRTDQEGRYRFTWACYPGDYAIQVLKPGFGSRARALRIEDSAVQLNFKLSPIGR